MRRTITGKRFNTETGTCLGRAVASLPSDDLHYWEESLWQTPRSKNYFIVGRGMALSGWGVRMNTGLRGPGEGIKPVSKETAEMWLEQNPQV